MVSFFFCRRPLINSSGVGPWWGNYLCTTLAGLIQKLPLSELFKSEFSRSIDFLRHEHKHCINIHNEAVAVLLVPLNTEIRQKFTDTTQLMEIQNYASILLNGNNGSGVWGCALLSVSKTFSFLWCTEGVGSQGWSSTTLLQVSNMTSFSFIAHHQGGSYPVAFKAAQWRRRRRSREAWGPPGARKSLRRLSSSARHSKYPRLAWTCIVCRRTWARGRTVADTTGSCCPSF